MGLGYCRIKFESGFPSLTDIQTQFYKQTGLNIRIIANLNIDRLNLSYIELISQLSKDAKEVDQLQTEFKKLVLTEPQNYEKLAQHRDYTQQKLNALNYLGGLQFHISQFYELDFKVEDNVIEIEKYSGQYFGIVSLEKSLVDLGGKLIHSIESADGSYPKNLQKLKKWQEYKWYNRPRK